VKIRVNNQQKIKISRSKLQELIRYVLAQEGVNDQKTEISVLLVDNARIRELNRKYLGHNRITDVISFRMKDGPFSKVHPEILGDVIVSVEQARSQAKKYKHRFQEEFWLYIVHGVQHLLGYVDSTSRKAIMMNKRGEELLRSWLGKTRKKV